MGTICKRCSSKKDLILFKEGTFCINCIKTTMSHFSPVNNFNNKEKKEVLFALRADKYLYQKTLHKLTEEGNILNFDPSHDPLSKDGETTIKDEKTLVPVELYDAINTRVVGQEDAKKAISVALARHQLSTRNKMINKVNVMMIGPSGTGKTEIIRSVEEEANIPVTVVDCSHLVPSGYKGETVDTILEKAILKCEKNIALAEKSIIFLDEFDKLANTDERTQIRKMVQQEILKMVEGGVFHIQGKKIDTSGILFVAAGAFAGIEKFTTPKQKRGTISLSKKEDVVEMQEVEGVQDKHLIEYGLIAELIGRFTSRVKLNSLDKDQIYKIVTAKKGNVVDEYKEIFKEMGHNVEFNDSFIHALCEEAMSSPLGARAIKSVAEKLLEDVLFTGKLENSPYLKVLKEEASA